MITLLIISMLACLGYAAYMKIRYNVSSISDSYYKTGKKVFFWCWAVLTAFTLLPYWIEVSGENYQFVAFLSAISLIAVGCFPEYKGVDDVRHPLFTSFCGALAIVWAILAHIWYIPVILILSTFTFCLYKAKWQISNRELAKVCTLYWCEVAAFVSLYMCVLIKLL